MEQFVTTKDKKEGAIRYLINEMKKGRLKIPERRVSGIESNPQISALRVELMNFGVKIHEYCSDCMYELYGAIKQYIQILMKSKPKVLKVPLGRSPK